MFGEGTSENHEQPGFLLFCSRNFVLGDRTIEHTEILSLRHWNKPQVVQALNKLWFRMLLVSEAGDRVFKYQYEMWIVRSLGY